MSNEDGHKSPQQQYDDIMERLRRFLAEYPQATVLDIMAEFDLSDTDTFHALDILKREHRGE